MRGAQQELRRELKVGGENANLKLSYSAAMLASPCEALVSSSMSVHRGLDSGHDMKRAAEGNGEASD